eukprot:GHVS01006994.1.p2 GENE.GHVS01006994.1~~GHVS01006994.1.p2  ORF type:complete len:318 (+),score=45.15 GHVS01006994.1:1039-1992(+)
MVLAQSLIPGLSVISITPLYDVPTDRSPNDAWPGVVAVAEVMKALPTLCNQAATVNHVLPVIIKMLRDPSPEIRVRVMECIPSLAGVVDIAYLTEVLAPTLKELCDEDDESWKTRIAVVQLVPFFCEKLSMDVMRDEGLWQLLSQSLMDKIYVVREIAGDVLVILAKQYGEEWVKANLLPELEVLRSSPKYGLRVDAIVHAKNLMKLLSPSFVRDYILQDYFLDMHRDNVPNVRFNVAKALLQLKIDFPEDSGLFAGAAIECLSQLAKDDDGDVRYYSSIALTTREALPKYTIPPLTSSLGAMETICGSTIPTPRLV